MIFIFTYNTPSILEDIYKASLRACSFKHCHVEGIFSSKVTSLNDKKYHPLCTMGDESPMPSHSTHPEQPCHLIQTTGVQRQQWHEKTPAEARSPCHGWHKLYFKRPGLSGLLSKVNSSLSNIYLILRFLTLLY